MDVAAATPRLDSNIIRLTPQGLIDAQMGPDLDVLVRVLDRTGTPTTELGDVELTPEALVGRYRADTACVHRRPARPCGIWRTSAPSGAGCRVRSAR